MEVDRAGVDRREGALGLDQAEHLARVALDHRDRVGRGRAQRHLGGDELAAARHHPPARPAQLARRDQPLGPLAPALAEDLAVGLAQRQLVGGRDHVPRGDLLVLVVEDRRLHRAADELVGVAAEELVERVLAGDVDGEAAPAAPRPPPHLAQAGDGAGEGDADRRVELADVDAQLERVGGDDGEQLAVGQPRLDLAPLLRRVAAAVGGDPRRQLGLAARLQRLAGEALDQLDPAPALEEADRPHARGETSSASRSAASESGRAPRPGRLVDQRRVPHRDLAAGCAARRRRRSARRACRPAPRPARPGWRSSPRRAGSAARRRRRAPPGAAAAARWRRGSRRRRGRCAPRRRRPSRGWRGSRPSSCGGAGCRRGACPGW